MHLSVTHPDLYVTCLQFLAVLFSEEAKRELGNKEDNYCHPTVTFLLDKDERSQPSVTKLSELLIQVEMSLSISV